MLDDGTMKGVLRGDARIAAHIKALYEHAKEYDRPWNEVYGRLIAFALDSQHYKVEHGFGKETRRIQPKSQILFDLLRHKGAWLKTQPIRVECKPRRPMQDLAPAELCRRLLENVAGDPLKRYKQSRNAAIDSALAASRGVMWAEWSHDAGGLYVCNTDPRHTFVAPGWTHPHDPTCPWVMREKFLTAHELRKKKKSGWRVPADLPTASQPRDVGSGGGDSTTRNVMDETGTTGDFDATPRYRVLITFFRDDPYDHRREEREPLPRDEWYLELPGGDRFPVPVEVDVNDPEWQATLPLDPETGAPPTLVIDREAPAYKRLCVVTFPDAKDGEGVAWKGDWFDGAVNEVEGPVPFPLFWYCSYYHPLRLVGQNDTLLNHTLQLLDNVTMRQAWEQVRQISTLIVTQKGALKDMDGRDFRLTDAPVQVAYADDMMANEAIKVLNASGMNPSLPAFRQMLERAGARVGTGDIPMPADRSRDVAGVTMQALQEMGDMPLRTHKMDLDLEESIFFVALLALMRAYMAEPELVHWTTDQGDPAFAELTGADLSPVHVIVGSSPDWKGLDAERVQAVAQYVGQMAPLPGGLELMAAFASSAGFSATDVQRIQQVAQSLAQQQAAMAAGGGPPPPEGQPQ